ncbi:MAG: T9SS C-terminal target domain-containing protein [Candidatus Zixiibacteriota bacterium]|nr:MAG: T9SS C-terminal target domain-containing protein [candidate division Zixibacteria bacterium]
MYDCHPVISNNTVVGNVVSDSVSGAGGGIYCNVNASYRGVNNILWDNQAVNGPQWYGNADLSYSCSSQPLAGTGNLTSNPLFVDPAAFDLHLQANSPCIDAGDPASPPDPDGTRADMGALYYDQSPLLLTYTAPDSSQPGAAGQLAHFYSEIASLTAYSQTVVVEVDWSGVPPGWTYSFTVGQTAYPPFIDSVSVVLPAGGMDSVGVNFFPAVNLQDGWASVSVYPLSQPAQVQTLTFRVDFPGPPANLEITLTPVNPPLQIGPGGGSFEFDATLANGETGVQDFDAWIMVRLPNQSWYGPVLGPLAMTLPGGASVTHRRVQSVPAVSPAGSYWYEGCVGVYPDAVWDTSGFAFTKTGVGDGGLEAGENWACTGEPFPGEFGERRSVAAIPETFALSISPNPFNPSTAIGYRLPAPGYVSFRVYDTAGREVATLVEGWREAGVHEVTFDGSGLPSGIYYVRLAAGDESQVQKVVLLK